MKSDNEQTKTGAWKNYIHYSVILFFMFIFKYIPPFLVITKEGMEILGVFIGMIYGWCTVGMIWTSVVAFCAAPLTSLIDLPKMLVDGFGSSTVVFLILMLIFCDIFTASGLANVVSAKMMQLKVIEGRPWGLFAVILLSCWLMGILVGQIVGVLIMMPIILETCKRFGYGRDSKTVTFLILGMLVGLLMGGQVLPIKGTPLMLCSIYSSMNPDFVLNVGQYLLFGIPFTFAILIAFGLSAKFIFRIDLKAFQEYKIDPTAQVAMSKRQKYYIVIFLLTISLLIIPGFLPAGSVKTFFDTIGNIGCVCMVFALMMLLNVEGKPLFDFRQAAKNSASWDIILVTATSIPVVSMLTNDATGIKSSIIMLCDPVLGNMSALLFTFTILAIVMILTNFMGNMPAAMMFFTVVLAYAPIKGFDPTPVVLSLFFVSYVAIATPAATTGAQMVFASGNVNTGLMIKFGLLSLLPMILASALIAVIWGNIVF